MAVDITIYRYKMTEDYNNPNISNVYQSYSNVVYEKNTSTIINEPESPIPPDTTIISDQSVTGDGSTDNPIKLLNDEESPGQSYYYGTKNYVKGFHSLNDLVVNVVNNYSTTIINNTQLGDEVQKIIQNKISDTKETYKVETTADTYTQQSSWQVTADGRASMGIFTVKVYIHDLDDQSSEYLENRLGWDYAESSVIQEDISVVTGTPGTLALTVDGSDYLSATVSNMTNIDNKRMFFCFERCITNNFVLNLNLVAETGYFTLTGYDIVSGVKAEQGSFILTGYDVSFSFGYTLTAQQGSYTLTGQDLLFLNEFTLTAQQGSYTLTGQNATLNLTIDTCVDFGALYNYNACNDPRGLVASGWHIPTNNEITTFKNYLSSNGYDGYDLADTDNAYWVSVTNFTNILEFYARGSGKINGYNGSVGDFKLTFRAWTSTESIITPYTNYIFSISGTSIGGGTLGYRDGLSVRPIKDITTLSHGEKGTYTGNDGKVYQTICIGTQEWLMDSLCETQYQNGENVQFVSNANDWKAISGSSNSVYDAKIPAMAAPNHNSSNVSCDFSPGNYAYGLVAEQGSYSLSGQDTSFTDTLLLGLVSYYKFEEASGDFLDLESSNDLTINGTITRGETAPIGDAFYLDGSSNSNYVSGTNPLSGLTEFTMIGWVKIEDSSLNGPAWVGGTKTATTGHFSLYADLVITNDVFTSVQTTDFDTARGANSANVGSWQMVGLKGYISGGVVYWRGLNNSYVATQDSGETDITGISGTIYLGRGDAATGRLKGWLSNFAFWNRELSSSECSRYYNSGSGLDLTTL